MTVYDLYKQVQICIDTEFFKGKKTSRNLLIVLGYAREMLEKIWLGEFCYGTFPIDGLSDAKDLTRNVLVNHCRAEEDYKNQLDRLCHEVSFGGNFECCNWNLAQRFGLKADRWQYRGAELLEKQAFYIKHAVLLIERLAGIKRDRNGGIIHDCK